MPERNQCEAGFALMPAVECGNLWTVGLLPARGETALNASVLNRYRQLLLAKQRELLPATRRTSLTAGRAEGHGGDPTDRASEEAQTALRVLPRAMGRQLGLDPHKIHSPRCPLFASTWVPTSPKAATARDLDPIKLLPCFFILAAPL